MVDRQYIIDVLLRYATVLDTKDMAMLESCFLPDALIDYGGFGIHEGFPSFGQMCSSFLDPLDSAQHMVTNFVIELKGDLAHCKSYAHAQVTKKGTPGGDNWTLGGTYDDKLIRTAEGWKIKRRRFTTMWSEGNFGIYDQ
jgi:hypothetical protein